MSLQVLDVLNNILQVTAYHWHQQQIGPKSARTYLASFTILWRESVDVHTESSVALRLAMQEPPFS